MRPSVSLMIDYDISGGSRIFPRGVRQLPKVLLFFNFVPENCMKMKEFGPPGGGARPWRPPLDPPMDIVERKSHFNGIFRNMLVGNLNCSHDTCQRYYTQTTLFL